jgi:adenylate cyclase
MTHTLFLRKKKPIYRRDRRDRPRFFLYGILISVFLFIVSLAKPTLIDFLHNRIYDTLLSTVAGEPSSIPVIVDIDEKSLRQYGQWPWPRYRVAILIEKLRALGASTIGLDMLFAEEDRTSMATIRKEVLRDFGVDLGFREVPPDLRDSDQRLADALSKGKVVLGYQFLFEEDSVTDHCLLHSIQVNKLGHGIEKENSAVFMNARGVSCNLKMLSQAAGSSGFFNVSPDPDGILRRVPLIIEYQGRFYPSLALATLMQSLSVNDILLKTEHTGGEFLCLNKAMIPLTS